MYLRGFAVRWWDIKRISYVSSHLHTQKPYRQEYQHVFPTHRECRDLDIAGTHLWQSPTECKHSYVASHYTGCAVSDSTKISYEPAIIQSVPYQTQPKDHTSQPLYRVCCIRLNQKIIWASHHTRCALSVSTKRSDICKYHNKYLRNCPSNSTDTPPPPPQTFI